MGNSNSHFLESIDKKYPAETSIVLRYRNAFTFGTEEEDSRFKGLLKSTSIREGSRIFFLLKYKGVEIFALDETSLMHTKTLKSIDGCVTTARCKWAGYDRVVLETGGNTGSALTAYGTRSGLETFCFIPRENLYLLNSKFFASPKAHLISVEDPGLVKKSTQLFGKLYGLRPFLKPVGAVRLRDSGDFASWNTCSWKARGSIGSLRRSAPRSAPSGFTGLYGTWGETSAGYPDFWAYSRRRIAQCIEPGRQGGGTCAPSKSTQPPDS